MHLHHRTLLLIVLALALLLQALVGMRQVHAHPAQGQGQGTMATVMPCHGGATDDVTQAAVHQHSHAPSGASGGSDLATAQPDCDHLSCCLALATHAVQGANALISSSEHPMYPGARLHGEHTLPELRPPI